jgi:phosphoribosylformylglycinamidine synthase
MAVVAAPEDAEILIRKAAAENLDAVVIARVSSTETAKARLRMIWQGKTIVDLSRRFLDTSGSPRSAQALINVSNGNTGQAKTGNRKCTATPRSLMEKLKEELGSLRSGSRRGLQEQFDGSIGAASVLFPWGGKEQGTPECGMAALLPAKRGCLTASIMSFGFDPALMEAGPFEGAKAAVKESLAKFACLGGDYRKARLSMQEYFERMESSESWGKPVAALLGALEAQLALEVPAIGGKDSMSGTYRDPGNGIDLSVPPTLVVFSVGTADAASIRSGALSGKAGNPIILLYGKPDRDEWAVFKATMKGLATLTERNLVKAAYPAGAGGIAAALALMAFGNMTGIEVPADCLDLPDLIDEKNYPGAVLAELDGEILNNAGGEKILTELLCDAVWKKAAITIEEPVFRITAGTGIPNNNNAGSSAELSFVECPLWELRHAFESPLAQVYPQTVKVPPALKKVSEQVFQTFQTPPLQFMEYVSVNTPSPLSVISSAIRHSSSSRPLAVLPVFPGTNCEWDMEKAFSEAGAKTKITVFRNRNADDIAASITELAEAIAEAQILALSGGFSAGDEPDGSGKFIANVFRSPAIADAVQELLEKREGLMLGICNGFQALIKLGLIPYGAFTELTEHSPALTNNHIGRHVSRMARTVVMPSASPWLAL